MVDRRQGSFRGEVGRKSKSVVLDSTVNYTFRLHSQGTNNNKFISIPCTTSSIFTAPHGYLVGTWPILRTGPTANLPLF
jgi:hypothetical protein